MHTDPKDNSLYSMRKQPSQSRSKATIDAILTAAAQVLIEGGYSDASTNRIADHAGVGIGSLYEYFPGKEAIFAELRRREDRKFRKIVENFGEVDTVREFIQKLNSSYIEFVKSNLKLHAALLSEVPDFNNAQEDYIHRHQLPWLVEFFYAHKDELRSFENLPQTVDFVMRAARATTDNYVLNSPEMLNDATIEHLLEDLLERFLFKE